MREVVGLAKSGDLEIEPAPKTIRPVTEAEVIASHHRQDRYRQHPLLRPLLTESPAPVIEEKPPPAWLDEQDVRRHVMAQLASMMGTTARALAKGYVVGKPGLNLTEEAAWDRIKAIAEEMHKGLVRTRRKTTTFLLLRK